MIMSKHESTIRLGVVPYLNVQPLISHLSSQVDGVEICAEVPSQIVPMLERREVDVAIVPAFSLATHPEWTIVPGVGIASDGPVESVLLLSNEPLEEIRRVHLDPASMTSAALVQILLRHHWNHDVEFIRRARTRLRAEKGTAHLVIGDAALRARRRFSHVLDLGEAWKSWSALPFVYAVWAVRPGFVLGSLSARLTQAPRFHNPALFNQIAHEHHREVGLTKREATKYLRDSLRFRIGDREMNGLRHYLQSCRELGLVPGGPVKLNLLPMEDRSALG
jgi:predicted solute-binding protein